MPQKARPWLYEAVEAGACGSQVYIRPARALTVEEWSEARDALDRALLQPENESWLLYVAPWCETHRFISGLRSETRAALAHLNKAG